MSARERRGPRAFAVALAGLLVIPLPGLAADLPVGLSDRGVYSDLDGQVAVALPDWVPASSVRLYPDRRRNVVSAVRGADPLKTYPASFPCAEPKLACLGLRQSDRAEVVGLAVASASPSTWSDHDGDGIPDPVDVLMGGKKAVLLQTPYVETAPKLPYPGGDLPREEGVCTDVVVRALRNAGIDLQKEVFEDAGRAPQAYPAIRVRNPSIDHRRVRNLMVYLQRHFRRVPTLDDLLPGDIVLLDTFPARKGVEHIGLVSDRLGRSGRPLIINAWTSGYVTSEMDLLGGVGAPAAYRVPSARPGSISSGHPSSTESAAPLPASASFRLDPSVRQAVVALAPSWSSPAATVSWWERERGGAWMRKGRGTAAMLGERGMGWGRGLLPVSVTAALPGPAKSEGDGRAPAGVFRLTRATGYSSVAPSWLRLPYQPATTDLRCVDDPRSAHYNQVVPLPTGFPPSWTSDEVMRRKDSQYELTIAVEHNRDPVTPGAGSCIFLHSWPRPDVASPGCTMLGRRPLFALARWLDPTLAPVLVQLPADVYGRVATAWDLPNDGPPTPPARPR